LAPFEYSTKVRVRELGKELKILILEDMPTDAELMEHELRKAGIAFSSRVVETRRGFIKELKNFEPDLILGDYKLPSFDGLSALKIAKEKCPHIPFTLVSSTAGEELAVEALKMGATDYVLKDKLFKLPQVVRRALKEAEDHAKRTEAEGELKRSEERLKIIFEFAPDALYLNDLKGNFVDGNKAAEELTGYKREELIRKSFLRLKLLSSDQIPKAAAILARNVLGKHTGPDEFVLNRKDGTNVIVEIRTHPIKVDGQSLVLAIAHDITERKKAEEEMRRTQESLAEAQRIGRMGNWDLDLVKNEFRWSDEIYRIFGLKPQEFGVTYEAFLALVHPDERELVDVSYKNAVKNKNHYDIIHRIVRPDGEVRYVQEKSDNIYDEMGKAIRSIGTVQDITERKRAEDELKESFKKLRKALEGIIQATSTMVEVKDPYTAGHQRRVTDLARAIATEMGLKKNQIEGIRTAGVIHDIGKIIVPSEILTKPSQLTEAEFEIIKTHPKVGYDILRDKEFPWPIAQIVYQHHERMDGSGYPLGISGPEILMEARVLAVADVVEAMASHRPYRPALGLDKALEEISKGKGQLYDPEVVDACLKIFKEKRYELKQASLPSKWNQREREFSSK
jgi:PAS domain S-box-containing protein/putative nucleotidyltransferase with HDIG domain